MSGLDLYSVVVGATAAMFAMEGVRALTAWVRYRARRRAVAAPRLPRRVATDRPVDEINELLVQAMTDTPLEVVRLPGGTIRLLRRGNTLGGTGITLAVEDVVTLPDRMREARWPAPLVLGREADRREGDGPNQEPGA